MFAAFDDPPGINHNDAVGMPSGADSDGRLAAWSGLGADV